MLLYRVQWTHDNKLTKGKGRVTIDACSFVFTVLCRNSKDAYRCFEYYFYSVYDNKHALSIDDGEIRMSRQIIDSRCFHPHYLLLDGIREPIYLPDPASNVLRATKIFGSLR